MSDAHGQPARGRRGYRIAGFGERSALTNPTSIGHIEDLIPGYALGALDANEVAAVDAHVRSCPACERALHEAQRTVGMLPFIVPMHAPSVDNKVALFARVAHVQKAAAASSLPMPHLDSYRTPTIPSSTVRDLGPATPVAASAAGSTPLQRESRSRWLVSVVSLPLLIALIATGFWGLQLQNQLTTQDAQLADLQAEFANFASGTTAYPLQPGVDAPQAEGTIVMGANQRDGLLQIDVNSKDGPTSYELLVYQDGKLEPVGEVTVNEDGIGQARIALDQPYGEYESVHIRAKAVDATGGATPFDTLFRDSEGPLGSTGSGLDIGP
ncbi:MAG: anti-sigma factor family protein [Thermomicrobiales bacterium]